MAFDGFRPPFFAFFAELAMNNERPWFEANRARYERDVKGPLVDFVVAMAPRLAAISPHVVADPRRTVFRIHRDTRFSRSKAPYKTNAGLHFRHGGVAGAHAPGYYVHLEPGEVAFGGGIWRPEPPALTAIREAIATRTGEWQAALADPRLAATFGGLGAGNPLTRPPRGFDPAHPAIADIRRRSFFLIRQAGEAAAGRPDFVDAVADAFAAAAPVLKFLTEAVGERF